METKNVLVHARVFGAKHQSRVRFGVKHRMQPQSICYLETRQACCDSNWGQRADSRASFGNCSGISSAKLSAYDLMKRNRWWCMVPMHLYLPKACRTHLIDESLGLVVHSAEQAMYPSSIHVEAHVARFYCVQCGRTHLRLVRVHMPGDNNENLHQPSGSFTFRQFILD